MQSRNPYAPSAASLSGSSRAETSLIWRDDKDVVLQSGSDLPHLCVKCNEPSDAPTKTRTLYWHNSWYYALFIISPLIYVIAALIARKTAKVSPGLCRVHKRRRLTAIAGGWLSFFIGMVVTFSAGASGYPGAALLCGAVMLGLMVTSVVKSRIVVPRRIDDRYIRLKGCGEEFLEALPQLHAGTRN